MNKAFSNIVESLGINIFKIKNRKKTPISIFRDLNRLSVSEIDSIYKGIKIFKKNDQLYKPQVIKSETHDLLKCDTYKMRSNYRPVDKFLNIYNSLHENHDIYFDNLKDNDKAKDIALIYLHGFSERDYEMEKKYLFSKIIEGSPIEIFAMQLPYHMNRSPNNQQYSGAYLFDSCSLVTIEGIRQAVSDVSQLITFLRDRYQKIIVSGFSLGGYVTSFLATCDNRANLYVIGQANADLPTCLNNLSVCPGLQENKKLWLNGKDSFQSFYQKINILNYEPSVTSERIVSIAGVYDKLVHFKNVLELRHFFNSKYNIDYMAGHIGMLFEWDYIKKSIDDILEEELGL